jgi:hypothetical protein
MAARLAALLRGTASQGAAVADVNDHLIDAAIEHGVAPLLHQALRVPRAPGAAGAVDRLPEAIADRLGRLAREALLIEAIREEDLVALIQAFAAAGIRPLLFKGAALGQSHYPAPWLRPRGDSDLIVRAEQAGDAGRILEQRGFERLPRPLGAQVTQQARYEGRRSSIDLAYDVHWRIADPHAFAHVLPHDELERDAVSDLPCGARRIGTVHALLVACIHRVAHHYDTDQLILLYDIDLLVRSLADDDWRRFVALAEANGVRAVCLRGLALAVEAFGSPVPEPVLAGLSADGRLEPSARYVKGPLRRIDMLRSDLGHLTTWRERAQLVAGHLFPGREYMAGRSGAGGGEWLPLAHFRRISQGARRWFRPLT